MNNDARIAGESYTKGNNRELLKTRQVDEKEDGLAIEVEMSQMFLDDEEKGSANSS